MWRLILVFLIHPALGNFTLRRCCGQNFECSERLPTASDEELFEEFARIYQVNHDYTMIHSKGNFCRENMYPLEVTNLSDITMMGNDFSVSKYYKWYKFEDICFEMFSDLQLEALVCEVGDDDQGQTMHCIGMIISMPFLLVTFLVYAILPERNLHQMALMFYVLSLLISYILLVIINLKNGLESPICEILGYSTLFTFTTSFFWMNVICFDIWFTFSGGRGFVGSRNSSERKKLALYSLYAFGVPLLIVLIVLVLDRFLDTCSMFKPGIGKGKCFLEDGWPNLWYFYGEAGILVITNIVFFALTAWKIRQVKKETAMLKHNDSKRHNYEKDKQKFNLYMKLLFAMGANWSMEVISWLVNWQTDSSYSIIWYVPDFFNAIYGVFIFFIFVFKKKIWLLLKRRYYNFIGKPHLANTMTSANTRTSHYSSTNYSNADTNISTASNGRARQEELALRGVSA